MIKVVHDNNGFVIGVCYNQEQVEEVRNNYKGTSYVMTANDCDTFEEVISLTKECQNFTGDLFVAIRYLERFEIQKFNFEIDENYYGKTYQIF